LVYIKPTSSQTTVAKALSAFSYYILASKPQIVKIIPEKLRNNNRITDNSGARFGKIAFRAFCPFIFLG